MKEYLITMSCPINLRKSYPRNMRKDRKSIYFTGTYEQLQNKVTELRTAGETIVSVHWYLTPIEI